MFRTSNPALAPERFSMGHGDPVGYGQYGGGYGAPAAAPSNVMTVPGAITKSYVLLASALVTASITWTTWFTGDKRLVLPLMIGGLVGGLIFALVTMFKAEWSPVTAPLYALAEGFALGGISALFEQRFPGIVINAVGLTFGCMAVVLLLYRAGILRATETFTRVIVAATAAVALVYLVNIVMRLFGNTGLAFIHDSGPIGIGFSLIVVGIAALNLVLDFDTIEQGAAYQAPKWMEWYSAFGLMLTLVWLYLESLKLLAKLQGSSRDD